MTRATYADPTTGEFVGEHETRDASGEIQRETEWFDTERAARQFAEHGRDGIVCACAQNTDGSTTSFLCSAHADTDPCATMASVTGKRRRGTIRRGTCTACGWSV